MTLRTHRTDPERGASVVEMALVAPFLLVILLGIIEFAFLFGEYNEVRHAAREGARFAAVSNVALDQDADGDLDADDVVDAVCSALDLTGGTVDIVLSQTDTAIGSEASVQITAHVNSLSNAPLISSFLPSQLSNTATFRLEQPATWSAHTETNAC